MDPIDLIAGAIRTEPFPALAYTIFSDTTTRPGCSSGLPPPSKTGKTAGSAFPSSLAPSGRRLFSLRGTNLPPRPNETDVGQPPADALSGGHDAANASRDLWFYSNPILSSRDQRW